VTVNLDIMDVVLVVFDEEFTQPRHSGTKAPFTIVFRTKPLFQCVASSLRFVHHYTLVDKSIYSVLYTVIASLDSKRPRHTEPSHLNFRRTVHLRTRPGTHHHIKAISRREGRTEKQRQHQYGVLRCERGEDQDERVVV